MPYGDWRLRASWVGSRGGAAEVTTDVPVTITGDGQGSAQIPPDFLNQVVQLVQQKHDEGKGDLGVWWNKKALVLELYADAKTYEYYNVELGEPGYTYELSATSVAGGLQQILEALGLSWWPGKEGALPQNLALALNIGKCIGVREIPPAPTATTTAAAVPDWVLAAGIESCDAAYAAVGGTCEESRLSEVEPQAACYNKLVALGMPVSVVTSEDSFSKAGCRWWVNYHQYFHNDNGTPASTCREVSGARRACPCS